jgi:hypothetical protein
VDGVDGVADVGVLADVEAEPLRLVDRGELELRVRERGVDVRAGRVGRAAGAFEEQLGDAAVLLDGWQAVLSLAGFAADARAGVVGAPCGVGAAGCGARSRSFRPAGSSWPVGLIAASSACTNARLLSGAAAPGAPADKTAGAPPPTPTPPERTCDLAVWVGGPLEAADDVFDRSRSVLAAGRVRDAGERLASPPGDHAHAFFCCGERPASGR